MIYRNLTSDEINALVTQSCTADDWSRVLVADEFTTEYIQNSHFKGDIKLGTFEKTYTVTGGIQRHCGIYNSLLSNVSVGNDCCIINVANYIANYEIGNGTYIENAGLIAVDDESTFGNGIKVNVLNETGGREVMIYDGLSCQLAYMTALYRHRSEFIEKVETLTQSYVDSVRSTRGRIGDNVKILNSAHLVNVNIGDGCSLIGVSSLENGSVNSTMSAPCNIGQGVVCKDFIICSGSKVTDCTMLTRCFVGQSCYFTNTYSASDSLFFSNCHGENGEACAIFAGPFTVTHHKSTLLIAGQFSFMNAGSGSNQSNHMYKLGPIHQGTLERGTKTASGSYVLWPARVGAFSLVMGRHVSHADTTNFPFSYLIEKDNTTYLVPGVNIRSVGTIRDAIKWPKRDGRVQGEMTDYINYNLLSPYTIEKAMKGLDILRTLDHSCGALTDVYSYQCTKIANSALHKGINYYKLVIDKFLGNSFISRLQHATASEDGTINISSEDDLRTALRPETPIGSGDWVDVGGLIAPKSEIDQLMDDVEKGALLSLEDIDKVFSQMYDNYYNYEWTWAFQHIKNVFGVNPSKMTLDEAIELVKRWHKAVIDIDNMVYDDAKKEFGLSSMIGFGADGDEHIQAQDFENVRGEFATNSFVKTITEHIARKTALAQKTLEALQHKNT